jgi:hypothetical protein
MKKTGIFLIGLLIVALAAAAGPAPQTTVLKVVVNRANVRMNPDMQSEVIAVIQSGTLLEAVDKTGEWYHVNLPTEEGATPLAGYIHQSLVTPVNPAPAGRSGLPENPRPAPIRNEPGARDEAEAQPVDREPRPAGEHLFSGFSAKIGWMTSPENGGFGDTWLASVAYDFGIQRNFALGFEIQPSFHSYSDIGLTTIPVLAFVNVKAGFNGGDLVKFLRFINVYGGIGAGAETMFSSIKFDDGESVSKFKARFAFHLLVGAEINLKAVKLVGEFQMMQAKDPAVDTSYFRNYILLGLRF